MDDELKRLLEAKADEMTLPAAIPEGLHGRVRRKRAFTVVVATAVAAGLVMGSATALSSLRGSDGGIDLDPAPELSDLPHEDFDIYTMATKGGELRPVTGGPDDETQPAWSPTENLVAFARIQRFGPGHIFVTSGEHEVQVSFGDETIDEVPAWSPDGKRIAFIRSERGDYEARIYVVRVTGLFNEDGTPNKDAPKPKARQLIPQSGTPTERWPTWSPDGKQIAFVGGDNTIYVVDADGSGLRPIFKDTEGVERIVWHAGTGNLLLTIHSPYDHFRIREPSGELSRRIGPAHIPQYFPTWSPNGKLIAFTTGDVEDDEIFVMRANGARRRRLTNNIRQDGFPSFSPNGRYIVFTSNR